MNKKTIHLQLSFRSGRILPGLALVAVILLTGCAPASPEPAASAAPGQTTAPVETVIPTPTHTTIPRSAFTAVPLATETPQSFEAPKEPTMPTATPIPSDPTTTAWINQAVKDLAGRLKLDEGEIQVVSFESVVWPDGGLGCPEPGVFYTQVLVEGFRIRLEHNGQTYNYHGSLKRAPFLCEAK